METNESTPLIKLDYGFNGASPKITQFTSNAECIKFIIKKDLSNFSSMLLCSIEGNITIVPEGEALIKSYNSQNEETEILWYPSSTVTALSGCVTYQLCAINTQNDDEVWYSCEGRLIVSESIDTTAYSTQLLGGEPSLVLQILTLVKAIEVSTLSLDEKKVDKLDGMGLSENNFTNEHLNNIGRLLADVENIKLTMPKVDESYSPQSVNAQSGVAVARALSQLIDSAPETLSTLKKLADAINNDPEFYLNVVDKETYLNTIDNILSNIDALYDGLAINTQSITNGLAEVDSEINTVKTDISTLDSELSAEISTVKEDVSTFNTVLGEKFDTADIVTDYEEWFEYGVNPNGKVPSIGVYSAFYEQSGSFLRESDIHGSISGTTIGTRDIPCVNAVVDYVNSELHPDTVKTVPTTLVPNTQYNLGMVSGSLSLSFPTTANDGDVIYLTFWAESVDDTPPNIVIDTTNTSDIEFVPENYKGYEIFAKFNGNMTGFGADNYWIVNYSEYEM